MIPYLVAGGTTLVVVALTAMNIFAWRAGKNATRAQQQQQEADALRQALETGQAIAQAGTNAPQTREELIDALQKGKEGK